MHAAAKLGGWALLVALTATVTAFATPADAATGPTATLDLGTLTVDGTAERDVLTVPIGADRTSDSTAPSMPSPPARRIHQHP